jgi:DUF1680 family protein
LSQRTVDSPRRIINAVPFAARPLPLSAVRLTGGPLKHAQDLDAKYLLELEPDRIMAHLRERAGLPTRAKGYGGWEGPGRNLTGHIAGHYLSAVSLMYAATGDTRFKERVDLIVREMKEVQDKQGDGYIGALQDKDNVDGKIRFQEVAQGKIRSGGFDLNGLWAPWYVQHKIFAGLRDAYRLTGNRTALDIEIRLATWAKSIVGGLDEAQIQQMLNTEFGGMNEVLADLYADTGDRQWLQLSDRFEHRAVRDPLARKEDRLGGLHANTQVPKFLGSLARYIYNGDATDGAAATFFWDTVVSHHSFATGGHGKDEYFGPPDALNSRIEGRTSESCNIYNMLKLTRTLFAVHPDIKYAEFQERALFNHVLGSIDPEDGRTCYMVPVGRGVRHEYQDMFRSFTCCVGSGMESHALHGDGIYYEAKDQFWVNLYTPSTVDWAAAGTQLKVDTSFPEGDAVTVRLTLKAPRTFTLSLRRPSWAGNGFSVAVNGKVEKEVPAAGAYVNLKRKWQNGDTVTLVLPKTLRTEPLPDNSKRVALLWGPLVLAGDLGATDRAGIHPTPVFVAAEQPVSDWLTPVSDKPGAFRSVGVGYDSNNGQKFEVDFVPFYRLHRRIYSAYWDLYTPSEWERKAAQVAQEQERRRKLEAATVAYAQPGEMQPERDFNQQGEETWPIRVMGRPGRNARRWFSFDLPVDANEPMTLVLTYNSEERRARTFTILVDGQQIAEQTISPAAGGNDTPFFDISYTLPPDLTRGKKMVTVRFQVKTGNETATIFGIRMCRTGAIPPDLSGNPK